MIFPVIAFIALSVAQGPPPNHVGDVYKRQEVPCGFDNFFRQRRFADRGLCPATHRRQQRNLVAFVQEIARAAEFVIARDNDALRHVFQSRELRGVMVENGAQRCGRGQVEPVFGAAADVL